MTKLTWLGDAECIWNEVTFQPGTPVEIDDPYMLGKARNSPFFKVETEVSFFDDPPETPSGREDARLRPDAIMPEMWTNPEDVPDRQPQHQPAKTGVSALKRKRGRPPKVRENDNGE